MVVMLFLPAWPRVVVPIGAILVAWSREPASRRRLVATNEKEALIAFVHAEAEAERDPRHRAFLLEFPQALGLRDEE
jgi:hypothetical protein